MRIALLVVAFVLAAPQMGLAQQVYIVDSNQKVVGEFSHTGFALVEDGSVGFYLIGVESGAILNAEDYVYFSQPGCIGQANAGYLNLPPVARVHGTDIYAPVGTPGAVATFQSRSDGGSCQNIAGQQVLFALQPVAKTTDWVPPFSLLRIPSQPLPLLPR